MLPFWKNAYFNLVFMIIKNSLYEVRARGFIEKHLGESKITEHL